MSDYRKAVKAMLHETLLICPHCTQQNIPNAKPMLVSNQDGSYDCMNCGKTFVPPEPT